MASCGALLAPGSLRCSPSAGTLLRQSDAARRGWGRGVAVPAAPRHVSLTTTTRRAVPLLVAEARTSAAAPSGKFLGKFGSDSSSATFDSSGPSSSGAMHKAATVFLPEDMQRRAAAHPGQVFFPLALAILAPTLGGILVSYIASPLQDWYRDLNKPSWEPPDWMFGAVWSVLYVLMGLASFLVWADGGWAKQGATLQLYCFQLALNYLWPVLFFKAHQLLPSAVLLGVLAFLVNATMRAFYAVNRVAGWLMLPYQAWVIFALFLNISIWRLNKDDEDKPLPGATWTAAPNPGGGRGAGW